MSGFIDFVVADETEYPAVLAHSNPSQKWPGFEWKWFGPVEVAGMYAVITGDTGDENRRRLNAEFGVLGMEEFEDPEEFGASVYRFSPRLLDILAGFGDADIDRVADQWAAYWQSKGWLGFQKEPESNRKVLQELSKLARQAKTAGKTILIRDAGAY